MRVLLTPPRPPPTPLLSPQIPFNTPAELLEEAKDIFKALLRFDTSNPPGQEKECADWCIEQLRNAGVKGKRVFTFQPSIYPQLISITIDAAVQHPH